jgi:hypothetical protein
MTKLEELRDRVEKYKKDVLSKQGGSLTTDIERIVEILEERQKQINGLSRAFDSVRSYG